MPRDIADRDDTDSIVRQIYDLHEQKESATEEEKQEIEARIEHLRRFVEGGA